MKVERDGKCDCEELHARQYYHCTLIVHPVVWKQCRPVYFSKQFLLRIYVERHNLEYTKDNIKMSLQVTHRIVQDQYK